VLRPDTILKRQAGIEIQLGLNQTVRIEINGTSAVYDEQCLPILNVFGRPTSVREGISKLPPQGIQDWIELTGTINRLYHGGVLVEAGTEISVDGQVNSFGAPAVHISMLNDRDRTETYLRGIREVVKPGDVVLDIGTGTGILAVAAARAGAAHVYAIEAATIADAAQAIFAANDVANRLTLIRGWSTRLELPERADVLLSEIIGGDPLEERVLQTTADARRRLLKPEARFIPSIIRVFGLAVTVPDQKLDQVSFTPRVTEKWRQWYGIDFNLLTSIVEESPSPSLRVRAPEAAVWPIISEPILLAEIDLRTIQDTTVTRVVNAETSIAGVMNGLLMFLELEVGSSTITTHPRRTNSGNHWMNPVWLLRDAWSMRKGDKWSVHYNYNGHGNNGEVRLTR
jgi:ribosomal protein L11 methyltransferase PrmA/PRMT5 arginine-N-methyltransferase